ncbi:hypothetical protein [Spiroplasma endosymbiont of Acasis viretata]|uniref:hypothetical protein n=1 Tax=Spiroplasma endosymbiont of Acasis viretata TaxID=3066306 RepID=UPI00313D4B66
MKTKNNSEQTPLLNKNNNNYNAIKSQDQPSTSQEHVNGYHQENLEVRNKDKPLATCHLALFTRPLI